MSVSSDMEEPEFTPFFPYQLVNLNHMKSFELNQEKPEDLPKIKVTFSLSEGLSTSNLSLTMSKPFSSFA